MRSVASERWTRSSTTSTGVPTDPTVGAFFDFDGTLIYGFSAIALQVARLRGRDVSPHEFAHALITGVGLVLGQADYDAVVSILGRAWRGRPVDEIDEIGRRLFKEKLAGRVYPEARALVAAHQRKGHTVVLASSALSFQVEAMAADLDIEHVLCTRLRSGRRQAHRQDRRSPPVGYGQTTGGRGARGRAGHRPRRQLRLRRRQRGRRPARGGGQPAARQPDTRLGAHRPCTRLAGAPVRGTGAGHP